MPSQEFPYCEGLRITPLQGHVDHVDRGESLIVDPQRLLLRGSAYVLRAEVETAGYECDRWPNELRYNDKGAERRHAESGQHRCQNRPASPPEYLQVIAGDFQSGGITDSLARRTSACRRRAFALSPSNHRRPCRCSAQPSRRPAGTRDVPHA
jgi:hypothetical protein